MKRMKEFFLKRKKFNQILEDIKNVKIQGARNIAKQALYAYNLIPTKQSKKKLISVRPTEPLLQNVLEKAKVMTYKELLKHFEDSQDKMNKFTFKLIKSGDVIFTHCHSTTVVDALIYAKKHGKKFEVYNTETRPLFQGRQTSKELRKAGINVTQFVDSAAMIALKKNHGTKKVDKVFIGADAILKDGVINKIGSGMFAQIAHDNKIPFYVISDSWKYSSKKIEIEERGFSEVWRFAKRLGIKTKNPAFELIQRKHIKGIISEFGLISYGKFLKKTK